MTRPRPVFVAVYNMRTREKVRDLEAVETEPGKWGVQLSGALGPDEQVWAAVPGTTMLAQVPSEWFRSATEPLH